jgi:hypothetical protein
MHNKAGIHSVECDTMKPGSKHHQWLQVPVKINWNCVHDKITHTSGKGHSLSILVMNYK